MQTVVEVPLTVLNGEDVIPLPLNRGFNVAGKSDSYRMSGERKHHGKYPVHDSLIAAVSIWKQFPFFSRKVVAPVASEIFIFDVVTELNFKALQCGN